jgi:replicative DNA helicase
VRDIPAILSESRRLKNLNPPSDQGFRGFGLLIIDYIQLVRGKGFSQHERLGQIAMDAKQVAKSLDVPVVALAQVDRSLAKRESPVPFLSDLRGSGDLEFAADNVIFCHRPEYYIERELLQNPAMDVADRADLEAALASCKGTMDLFVAKQRMGPVGKCRVKVDMGINRFADVAPQQDGMDF